MTTTKKSTKSNITVAVARASVVLGMETSLLPKETCKRKAFTEEEDVFMTRAYVNTTQDSIKGSGQKGKAFWNNVDKFHKQSMIVETGSVSNRI